MKCPECNGTGKIVKYFYERIKDNDYRKVCGNVTCEDCGGTGYIEQIFCIDYDSWEIRTHKRNNYKSTPYRGRQIKKVLKRCVKGETR